MTTTSIRPKFRAYGKMASGQPNYRAVYHHHEFDLMYLAPGVVIGDPGDYWILWHSPPEGHEHDSNGWPIWPSRFAAGALGCTDTYKTLREAQRAVLAICSRLDAHLDGSNVVPFRTPIERRAAKAR